MVQTWMVSHHYKILYSILYWQFLLHFSILAIDSPLTARALGHVSPDQFRKVWRSSKFDVQAFTLPDVMFRINCSGFYRSGFDVPSFLVPPVLVLLHVRFYFIQNNPKVQHWYSNEALPHSHDDIRLKIPPTLLELYLRYISYSQKKFYLWR